jgi:hypothetical protein
VEGATTAIFRDQVVKDALAEYASEQFEVACYTALVGAATELGMTTLPAGVNRTCRKTRQWRRGCSSTSPRWFRTMPSIQPLSNRAPEHLALLGDSIFANAAYVGREPDVIAHLRSLLPPGWKATLCAIDGATTSTLAAQLQRVPDDASRIIVAIGGNDALANIDLLSMKVSSSAETLAAFARRVTAFEEGYRNAIANVMARRLPTTICTIYNGALADDEARLARIALMTFNDVVLRTAFAHSLDVIDLRAICNKASDYANPIEPSGAGGRKIAAAIAGTVSLIRSRRPSHVWVG